MKKQNHKDAGQRTPGGIAISGSRSLLRRSLTLGILVETRNPLTDQLESQNAEGLDHRFLRSQPRVLGSGSLRKARPSQSKHQHSTQLQLVNSHEPNQILLAHNDSRYNNHVLGHP
jgi:hypothetical protein